MILRVILILLLFVVAYLSLTPKYTIDVGNDKLGHIIAYTTLSLNTGMIFYRMGKLFWQSGLALVIYGALLELGQHFVPGRTLSLYDMGANAIGVIIGTIVIASLHKQIERILRAIHIIR